MILKEVLMSLKERMNKEVSEMRGGGKVNPQPGPTRPAMVKSDRKVS